MNENEIETNNTTQKCKTPIIIVAIVAGLILIWIFTYLTGDSRFWYDIQELLVQMFGIIVIISIPLIIINIADKYAKRMQEIADKKGYKKSVYGWCFWLPIHGGLMVNALPDERIIELLKKDNCNIDNNLSRKQEENSLKKRKRSIKECLI